MSRFAIDLLGPFRLFDRGQPVQLGSELQRTLLAVLAIYAPQRVSFTTIADALWSASGPRPANERGTVQTYVARLRRVLPGVIATHGDGYRLAVPPETVDARRFRQLCDQATEARDTPAESDVIGAALAMWRGRPFGELRSEWLETHHERSLEEQYLELIERRADLELVEGRLAGLTADLSEIAARYPMHEPIWARLIRALELAGRIPEALQCYETIRLQIAETLGVDPGPELQAIYARLLGGPPTPRPDGASTRVVPRQLPSDTTHLVGRDGALRALNSMLSPPDGRQSQVVVTITGMAGVGKTALAVHWANRVRDRFRDGQLYVNLRGFDPNAVPADPTEVIRGFLDAFQIAPERIPAGYDAQAALYRSVSSEKQLLVILDNARDAAQVRPLLPGGGTCHVVVTSRDQLPGIVAAGALPVALDPLPNDAARQLLAARLGVERVTDEPEATDALTALCSGLPLALSIVAARAATHPDFRLDALAAELRDIGDCLDPLSGTDPVTDVRAVFSWSYRTLSTAASRVFRLLSLHPAHDVGVAAVASMAGLPVRRARALLAELHRAHLVAEPSPGRYLQHDLLRAYAAELIEIQETPGGRHDVEQRIFEHYTRTGQDACRRLTNLPWDGAATVPGVSPERITDYSHAMDWYHREHGILLALVERAVNHGWDRRVGQLASVLADYLDRSGRWHEWAIIQRSALEAARRAGDAHAEAHELHMLARANTKLGRHEEAHDLCQTAIDQYRRLGDILGEATAHRTLAYPAGRLRRYPAALKHARLALDLYLQGGDEQGVASSLNAVGWSYAQLGGHELALVYCTEALQRLERTGERRQQAATWDSLGLVHLGLDRPEEAIRCYLRSVELYRELGDQYGEAMTLNRLGDVHHAGGNPRAAEDVWLSALSLLDELGHPDAEEIRGCLHRLRSGV